MKTSAIIRIVCGVIVASLLSWILIFAILPGNSGWFPNIGFSFGGSYSNADAYSMGGGAVPMEQVDKIEINWTAGKVDVISYDGNEILFEEQSGSALKDEEQMRYLVRDGKLTIQYSKSRFFFAFGTRKRKTLTVKIPKELSKFELNTVSAQSEIDGLQARDGNFNSTSGDLQIQNATFEDFDADAVSGRTTLNNVTAQTAKFSTVSGDIHTEAFFSGTVKTDSVSGQTTLNGSFGEIKNNTTSGSIKIQSEQCPRKIDANGVSADVTIKIPDNEGFICELDSLSGDLDTDFDARIKDKTVIYGNGAAEFDINTTSGDVFIQKNG